MSDGRTKLKFNKDGPWDFFMSHKQSEANHPVAMITMHMKEARKKVWLDVLMHNQSLEAMMEGVENSANFVLILSASYFKSEYCLKELRRARELGKRIILCHIEGLNVGEALSHKPAEFEGIGDETSLQLVVGDAQYKALAVQRIISKGATDNPQENAEVEKAKAEAAATAANTAKIAADAEKATADAAKIAADAEKAQKAARAQVAAAKAALDAEKAKHKAALDAEKAKHAANIAARQAAQKAAPQPMQMIQREADGHSAHALAGKWCFTGLVCCTPFCAQEKWQARGDDHIHASGCGFVWCVYPICPINNEYHKKQPRSPSNVWSHPCGTIKFDNAKAGKVSGLCICGNFQRS